MSQWLRTLVVLVLMAVLASPAAGQDRGRSSFAPPGKPGVDVGPRGERGDHDRARDAVRSGQILPLGRIVDRVQNRVPGRLLDADLGRGGEEVVYRLRWLTPRGEVLNLVVDPRTGRILGGRGRR